MVIHQQLVAIYQQLGYQVVEVPWGEIKNGPSGYWPV
ncbi:hypothetical protein ETN89_04920 [Photobacterium damselae subsp. damselae]|nr:hypothetical protein CAY62_00095 [Photobacterium damselae subsp. damselae]QAY34798.1 hypothetical protein ETN89_04920 [Photobacterium damselae subsp. damselae]